MTKKTLYTEIDWNGEDSLRVTAKTTDGAAASDEIVYPIYGRGPLRWAVTPDDFGTKTLEAAVEIASLNAVREAERSAEATAEIADFIKKQEEAKKRERVFWEAVVGDLPGPSAERQALYKRAEDIIAERKAFDSVVADFTREEANAVLDVVRQAQKIVESRVETLPLVHQDSQRKTAETLKSAGDKIANASG